jgi:hypothetical protein
MKGIQKALQRYVPDHPTTSPYLIGFPRAVRTEIDAVVEKGLTT